MGMSDNWEVMSEKTREVPQLADATYASTLVIKSTHEYKINWSYGSNLPPYTKEEMIVSTFNDQSMNLSGFLRHYLLNEYDIFPYRNK